jgi:endonuclease/exonuclease/phosphatase family metal-dependent hydrolase
VSGQRLRVMSYNLWHCKNDPRMKRAAQVIQNANPDVVGLQECWRDGGGQREKIAPLAALLGWNDVFLAVEYTKNLERGAVLQNRAIEPDQQAYGIAILSPHPVRRTSGRIMTFNPSADEAYKERRGLLHAEIDVRGRALNFVTTHLARNPQEKEIQSREAAEFAMSLPGLRILSGDFNTQPHDPWYRYLISEFTDAWTEKGTGDGLTYSATTPTKRIDYIFYRPDDGLMLENVSVGDAGASDHFSLQAEFSIDR